MNYWINTVSRDHVLRAIETGFVQVSHGRLQPLQRLARGDWVVYYSPKTSYQAGKPLQAFTAIAQIADDDIFQVETAPGFRPWRRRATYLACAETPIKPLIGDLRFIEDKAHWGYRFRFSLIQIPESDFLLIREAMGVH